MNRAIQKYQEKYRKYPANLRLLVPKFLPKIPVDPVSGSNAVHSKKNGEGGWWYEARSGFVRLNTNNSHFDNFMESSGEESNLQNLIKLQMDLQSTLSKKNLGDPSTMPPDFNSLPPEHEDLSQPKTKKKNQSMVLSNQ